MAPRKSTRRAAQEVPCGTIAPDFGKRSHRVTHDQARKLRGRFLRKYPGKAVPLEIGSYHRKIFDTILAQEKCIGIRFYPGVDERGRLTLLFCGINGETGNDILEGTIGDIPVRCPIMCSGGNGILQF